MYSIFFLVLTYVEVMIQLCYINDGVQNVILFFYLYFLILLSFTHMLMIDNNLNAVVKVFIFLLVSGVGNLFINIDLLPASFLILNFILPVGIFYLLMIDEFILNGLIHNPYFQVVIFFSFLTWFFGGPMVNIGTFSIAQVVSIYLFIACQWCFLGLTELTLGRYFFWVVLFSIQLLNNYSNISVIHSVGYFLFLIMGYLFLKWLSNTESAQFFDDFKTIEVHYEREFWLYNQLRKLLIINVIILWWYYPLINSFEIFQYFQEGGITYIYCSLFLLLSVFTMMISLIIIFHCNPVTTGKVFQVCLTCTSIGTAGFLCYASVHITSTCPVFHPMPLPWNLIQKYQVWVQGYSWQTNAEGQAAHAMEMINKAPILYEGTSEVNGPLNNQYLYNVSAVNYNEAIQRIPFSTPMVLDNRVYPTKKPLVKVGSMDEFIHWNYPN